MKNTQKRLYQIELLRFIANLGVVFYHFTYRGFIESGLHRLQLISCTFISVIILFNNNRFSLSIKRYLPNQSIFNDFMRVKNRKYIVQ